MTMGLCECGCGTRTRTILKDAPEWNRVKGEPSRFIHGHNRWKYKTIRQKLEERINKLPNDGCWIWTGKLNRTGYGLVSINRAWRLAHRMSYQEFVGPLPDGHFACHKCDTPACIRPDHLFAGTPNDNVVDMVAKGRTATAAKGRRTSKLTPDDVAQIRTAYAAGGVSQRALGAQYGVGQASIRFIVLGRIWKSIQPQQS